MRIIAFALTAVIQLSAAAAGFLLLLLGMNGYNERDAAPGLYLYIALGLGSALAAGLVSGFSARWLVEKRSLGRAAAAATAVLGSSVLGGLILVFSFFAAIALAEVARGSR